ncbi:MAG: Uma2 family endonuclease [Caulobacteraceae bacterium]|nr:Uma2 family endonuclease [Caulobacter sp.]
MTIHVTRAAEGLDRRAFTIADMERMVEVGILAPDERVELIGGELVPMSAKGSRHEAIKAALNYRWGRACPDGFLFVPETGLRLDAQTYVEPDFVVVSRTKRLAEVTGPDVLLAVEVADSSLDFDLHRKPRVYAAFGVRELWVIDARRRLVHRHDRVTPNGYSQVDLVDAATHLMPRHAPEAFALSLDSLEDV